MLPPQTQHHQELRYAPLIDTTPPRAKLCSPPQTQHHQELSYAPPTDTTPPRAKLWSPRRHNTTKSYVMLPPQTQHHQELSYAPPPQSQHHQELSYAPPTDTTPPRAKLCSPHRHDTTKSSGCGYRKLPKILDTQTICCNHPKIWTRWLYKWVMCPKGAAGMANSVDPD